jgi:uncharacterized protein
MAAINLSSPYSQNFDVLASSGANIAWVNDSTISGWYSNQTTYDVGSGSSNAGALYSFGATGPSAIDRALGAVSSGSTGTIFYGVQLRNNTTSNITGLNIRYIGEQWRNSGTNAAQTVDFQYLVGATNIATGAWVDFNALDFTSPVFSATSAALDGNLAANRTVLASTLSVTVNPGQEIWLRWSDVDHSGADHGLAIDNFIVSPITASSQPVPEPMDFMGTIVAIFAAVILKRRFSAKKISG